MTKRLSQRLMSIHYWRVDPQRSDSAATLYNAVSFSRSYCTLLA